MVPNISRLNSQQWLVKKETAFASTRSHKFLKADARRHVNSQIANKWRSILRYTWECFWQYDVDHRDPQFYARCCRSDFRQIAIDFVLQYLKVYLGHFRQRPTFDHKRHSLFNSVEMCVISIIAGYLHLRMISILKNTKQVLMKLRVRNNYMKQLYSRNTFRYVEYLA